jgi:hypothetical protein
MSLFLRSAVSALLSLLFVVVYGAANWAASRHAALPSIGFSWEAGIPFVPLFIVPYMTIDLFFIAAPFLVKTRRELKVLAQRLAAAILAAGVFFLLFPLQCTHPRGAVDGILGAVFNCFRTLDPPFNQFPSLHIALGVILVDFYLRHSRGVWRFAVGVWFGLIFMSPAFTHQHHLLDIPAGAFLGAACLHFFDELPLRQPFVRNVRVGAHYAIGAGLCAAAALAVRGWAVMLAWPAFSLTLVAAGYFWLGAGIYRKRGGRLTWTTWALLWPVLLGQRLSLIYYRRRAPIWNAVSENLTIGRKLLPAEAEKACANGITAVLDLACEFSEARPFRSLRYLQLSILDLTAPTAAQMDAAIDFIGRESRQGIVYVHCKIGYSRTAAIAGAWLLASGQAASAEDALEQLRRARPGIVIRPEAAQAVQDFAAGLMRAASA